MIKEGIAATRGAGMHSKSPRAPGADADEWQQGRDPAQLPADRGPQAARRAPASSYKSVTRADGGQELPP